MAVGYGLRGYRREDLRQMYALDVACFAEPFRFSLAAMRRFAEAGNAQVVVAEEISGAAVLGFVIVHVESRRTGYVVTLDVAPEHRRRGIAAGLMERAEELAGAGGARRMALHVHTGNESAIGFYEARGYGRMGLQRGFYGDSMDAFVYSKELVEG